jgi:hypothetical protein
MKIEDSPIKFSLNASYFMGGSGKIQIVPVTTVRCECLVVSNSVII